MIRSFRLTGIILLLTSCSSITIKKEDITRGIPEEIKIIQLSDLHLNKEKKIYRKDKNTLFVYKGIGNSAHDFRLFAKPNIYLVTIK